MPLKQITPFLEYANSPRPDGFAQVIIKPSKKSLLSKLGIDQSVLSPTFSSFNEADHAIYRAFELYKQGLLFGVLQENSPNQYIVVPGYIPNEHIAMPDFSQERQIALRSFNRNSLLDMVERSRISTLGISYAIFVPDIQTNPDSSFFWAPDIHKRSHDYSLIPLDNKINIFLRPYQSLSLVA
jgi:hypothetical protein